VGKQVLLAWTIVDFARQIIGYDLGVVAYDTQQDVWTDLLPGGSVDRNQDYRVWGKRIYAMADGTVVSWENNKPSNPNPAAVWYRPTHWSRAITFISSTAPRSCCMRISNQVA
jgi:hypothetical protein